mgnify:CR=1 FL=1
MRREARCSREEKVRRYLERHRHHHHHGSRWRPRSFAEWRMRWAMRRRLFLWFGVAILLGVGAGHLAHEMSGGKWWAFVATLAVLWMASGAIAYRLTRPLMMVIDAAQRIGDGDLTTRIPVTRHRGELVMLAESINEMAARIEKQLSDQRALLAAVSHELRTPLGHVRVLLETARDAPGGEFIHKQIVRMRDEGSGVLLVSTELDEILSLSDRIAVMYAGQIIDIVDAADATRESIGLLMAGIRNGVKEGQA